VYILPSFVIFAFVVIGNPPIIIGLSIPWVNLNSLIEIRDSLIISAFAFSIGISPIVISLNIPGIYIYGLGVISDGLVKLASVLVGNPTIVVGLGISRVYVYSFSLVQHGLIIEIFVYISIMNEEVRYALHSFLVGF